MATASACKRKVLTIEEKINVLKLSEQGKSCREIARNLSVGKTQVQSIIKNKETLKTLWKKGVHAGRKIVNRRCLYPDLNEKLYEWFEATRSENNPITGRLLQEKAILLSNELGYDNFAASNGWLHSFQTRHNIKCAEWTKKSTKRRVMYATGGRLCPVKMLRLLIEKSEPECKKLFNQFNSDAIHNPQNRKYWFVAKPIVMSSTKIFMPNICKLAKTKNRYTNHCLSVTALHCYENADKEVKSIMFH
ncbi:hypothetical protein FSP39_005881 [Pinctada imbricata]|uniref:HTH CENPB-type domain-containing protein n=1 Tax=Pinctada imbricata TaxID=66713 RepID=A0AA89BU42_PINIB|nr:hypothetical protein FSP39_005881 [Pinctada imbricata]